MNVHLLVQKPEMPHGVSMFFWCEGNIIYENQYIICVTNRKNACLFLHTSAQYMYSVEGVPSL